MDSPIAHIILDLMLYYSTTIARLSKTRYAAHHFFSMPAIRYLLLKEKMIAAGNYPSNCHLGDSCKYIAKRLIQRGSRLILCAVRPVG